MSSSSAAPAGRPSCGALSPLRLWLGCNAFGHIARDDAARLVDVALEGGISSFDTADVYAGGMSESELGRLLPEDRTGLMIATKFGHPSSAAPGVSPCSPGHIEGAVRNSLDRLRCDRIDLYIMHFPDATTPIRETLDALRGLLERGVIAAYGASNISPHLLAELLDAADQLAIPRPLIIQEEYNLLRRDLVQPLLSQLDEHGIGLVPFFPLASGLLTGKYRDAGDASDRRVKIVRNFSARFLHADNLHRVKLLRSLCERRQVSMTGLALQWLLRQPVVTGVAVGASNADQVRANLAALAAPIEPSILAEAEALMVTAKTG